ncbi:MAG: beta-N-acetylhexosaminidase, partial [Thermorudis peleae]|nr:beta-N-acetylhexosaminidase [Thermorudis peleae]
MTTELPLLPMPREVTRGPADEAFTLTAHTAIVLSAAASEETFFAARWLQAAVREVTGLTLTIRRTLSLDEAGAIVLAVAGRDEAAGTLATLPAEGYSLRITADRVTVTGADEAGLFYGVQTLCQLIQTQGGRLPALTIRDWPRLANRGVMLDVSRGKVPTRETLYRLIDYLA